jgi:hypothetical protein
MWLEALVGVVIGVAEERSSSTIDFPLLVSVPPGLSTEPQGPAGLEGSGPGPGGELFSPPIAVPLLLNLLGRSPSRINVPLFGLGRELPPSGLAVSFLLSLLGLPSSMIEVPFRLKLLFNPPESPSDALWSTIDAPVLRLAVGETGLGNLDSSTTVEVLFRLNLLPRESGSCDSRVLFLLSLLPRESRFCDSRVDGDRGDWGPSAIFK